MILIHLFFFFFSLDELEKQDEDEIAKQFKDNDQRMKRLFTAFVLLLVSRSELLCYFLMILDQMVYGSLLSLPLPLMVFLWGMLSVPRPSKTFWVTVITYTEVQITQMVLFQSISFPVFFFLTLYWDRDRMTDCLRVFIASYEAMGKQTHEKNIVAYSKLV